MKQKFLLAALMLFAFQGIALADAAAPVKLDTDEAKLSYVFGLNMGMNFHKHQIPLDNTVFMQGLNTGLTGAPPAMTPAQVQEVLKKFQKDMMARHVQEQKALAAKNLTEGEAFMKNFVAQKGVVKVSNDLAYRVINAGNGAKPNMNSTVSLIYEGKLINGTVFDSTKRNGDKPIDLPLSHVIPGMQTILTMMPVGSTWEVVMSPKVAYGASGVPMSPIEPNATLIFNLSLKGISAAKTSATPAKS